jgi:predicted deacylase
MMKYTLARVVREGPMAGIGGTTTATAAKLKLPHVLHEAGRTGLLEKEDVNRHVVAVRNVMKYLGMVEGKPVEPEKQIRMGSRSVAIRAEHGGFLETIAKPGLVTEGQLLGYLYNVFGEVVQEIKAPMKGVLLIVSVPAAKCVGDALYSITEVVE